MATKSPIHIACVRLAQALDEFKVPYAIMGGAACFILGSTRVTDDVDLCVDVSVPESTMKSVQAVNDKLMVREGFTKVDEGNIGYFIPAVVIPSGLPIVPLELFDPKAWPKRPQYALVTSHRVARKIDGTNVYVFTPAWLLREKIETVQERPGKLEIDLQDIEFLCSIIPMSEYRQGLLDLRQEPGYAKHLQAFLTRADVPQQTRSKVQSIFHI